ncbi:MAG: acyl dehydratase [Alphaproteobacteria bacterium]|nr:acyl dehydratase [Alphaproteobacteria bacterium]
MSDSNLVLLPDPARGPVGKGLYWDEFKVGWKFRTVGRTLREPDIMHLVHSAIIHEVLFTNRDYVEKESVIKGRFAPGPLVYLMAEALIMPTIQATAIAFLGMETKSYRALQVGETMYVDVEITDVRPTKHKDRGIVTSENVVKTTTGEVLQIFKPSRMIKGSPKG